MYIINIMLIMVKQQIDKLINCNSSYVVEKTTKAECI